MAMLHVNCWQCNRRLTTQSGERYVTLRVDPKTLEEILVCSEACAERARRDPRWELRGPVAKNWRVSTASGRAHWFGRSETADPQTSACLLGTSEGLELTDSPENYRPCLPCIRLWQEELKKCHPKE